MIRRRRGGAGEGGDGEEEHRRDDFEGEVARVREYSAKPEQNFMFWGCRAVFKVGDTARAGMAVAQIPDLNSWEIGAKIRAGPRTLAVGQPAEVKVVAMPRGSSRRGSSLSAGRTGRRDRKFEFVCAGAAGGGVAAG